MTDLDTKTAAAFSRSWNMAPVGSVYTPDQFSDWLHPITKDDVFGLDVLELGCGNASLMQHMIDWSPTFIEGVELGNSAKVARSNMLATGFQNWRITRAYLTNFDSKGFDLVYCIGVLHHLNKPQKGLDAVIRNTKPGGHFHCWVYAREGNLVIRLLVEPLRRLCLLFPWWVTRYLIAIPLTIPYFIYAKVLAWLPSWKLFRHLPRYEYSLWIAQRVFNFFRHVAFDQLIATKTTYVSRGMIERWLVSYSNFEPGSTYITLRNGNSWKFGGKIACES